MQLLQLVHGQDDESVRVRSTLEAHGRPGRGRATSAAPRRREFGPDYALLRLLEHRIQLRRLQRTHLMPVDEDELRVLARSTRAGDAAPRRSSTRWQSVKLEVRGLHERLFYRPLLSAVAPRPTAASCSRAPRHATVSLPSASSTPTVPCGTSRP